jgi:aryl-alcohol dehydrogenase-like predicted oxidoreductase
MLDTFVDQGGNFIDTAEGYGAGTSEEIIGDWLSKRGGRDELVLATKLYGSGPTAQRGLSRKHVIDAAESSLRRLRTDYIDLYQPHLWDPGTPVEETMLALESLVRRGLVRYVGVSNFFAWQLVMAAMICQARSESGVVSLQVEYNLLERSPEREQIPACEALGLGLLAWSPLGGGWLTGKHASGSGPTSGTRVVESAQFWQPDSFESRANERTYAVVEAVRQVALERGISLAQVALAWLLRKRGVIPIVGARTLEQLEDNLSAKSTSITEEDLALLDEASSIGSSWLSDFIERFAKDNERRRDSPANLSYGGGG